MNKNLIISFLIIAIFFGGAYFIIKKTPNDKVITFEMNRSNIFGNNIEENNNPPEMFILEEGQGEKISKSGDTLSVFYVGYLQNGEIFDSNIETEQPFEFVIGSGQVISGWDIGLRDMKIGEVRRLILPPSFAYGNISVGSIPANSTLIFEVELVDIK